MEKGHGRRFRRNLLSELLDRLPQFCCFCHRKTDTRYDLCQFCRLLMPTVVSTSSPKCPSSLCLTCGFSWPDQTPRITCVNCANYQTKIDRIICPFRYDFPIDGMIGRLKYQRHLVTGRLLGNLLAEEVKLQLSENQLPELIVPVPLNTVRFRSRGFNHAAEIAHWCGKSVGVNVLGAGVGRRLDTGSLVGLSRTERGLRIRGAFWADEALRGRSVAIVDDVLTTGATSGELATELLDQGAASVQVWVVARTPVIASSGFS